MKLHELKEMAIRGGNFRPIADKFATDYKKFYQKHKAEFKHIGDVEIYPCYKHGSSYFLFDDSEIIFICSAEKSFIEDGALLIDSVWLDSKYEGKKIYSKLLWFLRSREGVKKLILGNQHSEDTYNLLKAGGLSAFNKTWINTLTDEREPFDKDTIDKYYAGSNANWKLMLESNSKGDELTEEVKNDRFSYVTDLKYGYVKSVYDWQIQ